jgi:transcriptional regulator of acetoin/glycerol metabolism
MTATGRIEPEDLALSAAAAGGARSLDAMTLQEAERYLVERALLRAQGNAGEAARALGLSRSAFYRRLSGIRGAIP